MIAFFVSCSHNVPEFVETKSFVVFEYDNFEMLPKSRLSVFAEMKNDVRKTSSIKVKETKNGYTWDVSDVVIFKKDNKQWVGTSALVFPSHKQIQKGSYTLSYIDGTGNIVETVFSISFPDKLLTSNASELNSFLQECEERIAIFDVDENLLYFKEIKSLWQNDENIWKEMKQAFSYRKCLVASNGKFICLLPLVKKS